MTEPLTTGPGESDTSPPQTAVAAPESSWLPDLWARLHHHKVMQWTLAYAAAAYTLLHGTEMVSHALHWPGLVVRITLVLLILGRAGVGIGETALSPAAYSLLSDYFPPRRLPAAMSFYNMGPAVGAGLAFMLGGAIIASIGNLPSVTLPLLGALRPWQVAFVFVGLLGSVFVLLLTFVKEPPRRVMSADIDRSASFADTARFFVAHWRSLGALFSGLSLLSIVSYGTMAWYPSMLIRTYGENVSRVGLTFGAVFMVSSVIGNAIGAWGAVKFADRGYRDPYIRWIVMVAASVCLLGTCVPLMPTLVSTYASSALLLAAQGAFMAAGVSAMHLAVPNRMRAQLTAMLLFGTNIVGLVLGPSGVAAITQFVFRDPLAVRYALSIVSLSAGSLATLMLWVSWLQFPRLSQRATA